MLALRVHSFDRPLQLDEQPLKQPGTGEVRVRLHASGVSFFDMLMARGGYQWRPPLPFTAGSEFSGVIEGTGAGVSMWRAGDRVCGSMPIGAWAETLCIAADAVYPVEAGQDFDAASVLITTFGTALYGLRERGNLRSGETVLVLGAAGSVGEASVQVAAVLGAHVIAAVTGQSKAEAARASGASAVVDMSAPDWKDEVKKLAGPHGVDVVVDPVGGPATDAAFRTLGWNGRHLMVGFASGDVGRLKSSLAIVKGGSLIGVDARRFRELEPERARAVFSEVAALHRDFRIRPRIAATFPFADHAVAFQHAQDRTNVGRVLLRPGRAGVSVA